MANNNPLKVWTNKEIEVQRTKTIRRLSFKNLAFQIADAFNLDKGFIHTFKGLFVQPAATIRDYLDLKRDLITNPVKYFLLIVGTTIFIGTQNGYYESNRNFMKGIETGMKMPQNEELSTDEAIQQQKFIQSIESGYYDYFLPYQNIWTALIISFSSIFTFLFFRKSGYNFIEHNVINTYIYTHTYLIMSLIIIFKLNNEFWSLPYFIYYLIMSLIAYKGLFGYSWWKTISKTFFAFLISIIVLMIALFFAGVIFAILTLKYNN